MIIVGDRRSHIDHAGREQHGACADRPFADPCDEVLPVECEPVDRAAGDERAELHRLVAHAAKQFLAFDPAGIAGMIARARDPRRATFATVNHLDRQVEAREIDRGRQTRWSAADDEAIKNMIHAAVNKAVPRRFRLPSIDRG